MLSEISTIPFGMAVAAKTTELDNIKVELSSEPIGTRWAVYINPDKVENYETVLAEKLSSVINENIKYALEKDPNVKLHIYVFAQLVKDGNFVAAISKCEIR